MEFQIKAEFDERRLKVLLEKFRANVTRECDKSLADLIQNELLESDPPTPRASTYLRLAKWCRTNGNPYQDASVVARQISELLFGYVLDRRELGV